jgi:plastocyanin
VRARRQILIAVIALLAGAAVALPTAALSETAPSVEAVNEGGIYGETHRWRPSSVTVAPGASVTFSNPTAVQHGIYWTGPVPACEGTVPVNTSNTHWSGACTFSKAGVYSFYCTVHGPSMSGTITVEAPGTTPAPNPSPYPTGTTPSQPQGPAGGGGGSTAPAASSTPSSGPLAGARLLGVSSSGGKVKGTLEVPAGGAGANAQIEVLASRASLAARAKRPSLSVVARVRRSNLHAGRQSFSVRLYAKALHALHVHHRLAVVLRVALRAPASAAGATQGSLKLSRSLVLRG